MTNVIAFTIITLCLILGSFSAVFFSIGLTHLLGNAQLAIVLTVAFLAITIYLVVLKGRHDRLV